MAKQFKWRTAVSGTEGVTHVFIHEKGSNEFGDGTRQNPYQTLDYWSKNSTPTKVTCIGTFTCPMLNGNHNCTIEGDYYGAATFDGKGIYCIYGFTLHNIRVINTGIEGIGPGSVFGVGRAHYANLVGNVNYVCGVASSFCFLDACLLYMGCMGSTHNSATPTRAVYSRCKTNEGSYRLSIAKNTESTFANNDDVTLWRKSLYQGLTLQYCIFGKQVVVINDKNLTFKNCFFASDVQFWCFQGTEYNAETDRRIIPVGETSEEIQASIIEQINAIHAEWGIDAVLPTFTACKFSKSTSYDIFVDVDRQCYNLQRGCDAVTDAGTYYGALPPAIYCPVHYNSAGIAECWDERSVGGCVTVVEDTTLQRHPVPGIIAIDETSTDLKGEILSKIITINPQVFQLSGFYAFSTSKFNDYATMLNKNSVFSNKEYIAGEALPVGRYKVRGSILLRQTIEGEVLETEISNGGNAIVLGSDASFVDNGFDSVLMEYENPNHMEVLYCRCRSTIYARVGVGNILLQNVTYYNDNAFPVTYHGRIIAPKESFVCEYIGESFTCEEKADATIAIMFDDRKDIDDVERLVPTSEFVPAQLWGEYFVDKSGGVMQHDADGIPISSGNYLAWQTTANGGYSDRMHKSILNQKYVQLAIFVTKHPTV